MKNREIISRTINKNSAVVLLMDKQTRKVGEYEISIPSDYTTAEKAERFFLKHFKHEQYKFISCEEVKTAPVLFGMYLEDFVKLARAVDERDKTTRNCVTKEVVTMAASYEYVNENRNIEGDIIFIPARIKDVEAAENYIRKNKMYKGRLVGVTSVYPVKQLYALSEEIFVQNARPMLDRFHIAGED